MEFKVLDEEKNKLVFELVGENHTFCNLLKSELKKVKGVTLASYRIEHPLVGIPTFILETKGTEPRKALKEALKSVKKLAIDFQKQAAKL